MAEKDVKKTKKKLVIADAILDLGFVDKLPAKRKIVIYTDLVKKKTIARKTTEADALKVKLLAAETELKEKK